MKNVILKIKDNHLIAKNTYRLILSGDLSNKYSYRPGSFVNLKIPGFYLRRPISICDVTPNKLTLIYKVVGEGTLKLSKMKKGEIDTLIDMGNGYNVNTTKQTALLVGGGAGIELTSGNNLYIIGEGTVNAYGGNGGAGTNGAAGGYGVFYVRIEDTDTERYVEGSVQIIYDTMRDSKIMYDEGPDVGGDFGPYIQSERQGMYKEYAELLLQLDPENATAKQIQGLK